MAEEHDEGEVSARQVLPVALTAAGAIAALWWLLRNRGKRADRPIIMTGGSFHLWGLGGTIQHHEAVGGHHLYTNPGVSGIGSVVVRTKQRRYRYTGVVSLEIWYSATTGDADVILRGNTISIRSDSAADPLDDLGPGSVNDDFGSASDHGHAVLARHYRWNAPGYIARVHPCCGVRPVDGTPEDPLRVKVHYV